MTCTESVTERASVRIQWLNALSHLTYYIIALRTKVNVTPTTKTLPFKSTIVAHDGFCSVRFMFTGFVHYFDQKFKDFSRPFKDTFFHFLRTQERHNQAHIMPH